MIQLHFKAKQLHEIQCNYLNFTDIYIKVINLLYVKYANMEGFCWASHNYSKQTRSLYYVVGPAYIRLITYMIIL